mmetsp:Transcript_16629/g.55408  ORF Transcript_16629/g.55408 Transcript_16629/m.55408 type:complete len:201 (-) Transcript_16629:2667-3269(-)
MELYRWLTLRFFSSDLKKCFLLSKSNNLGYRTRGAKAMECNNDLSWRIYMFRVCLCCSANDTNSFTLSALGFLPGEHSPSAALSTSIELEDLPAFLDEEAFFTESGAFTTRKASKRGCMRQSAGDNEPWPVDLVFDSVLSSMDRHSPSRCHRSWSSTASPKDLLETVSMSISWVLGSSALVSLDFVGQRDLSIFTSLSNL